MEKKVLKIKFVMKFQSVLVRILILFTVPILFVLGWKRKIFQANREKLGFSNGYKSYIGLLYNTLENLFLFVLFPTLERTHLKDQDRALLQKYSDEGGLLLAMHFGNFEHMCSIIKQQSPNFLGAYKPLKALWAHRFLMYLRARNGNYVDAQMNSPLRVLRFLQKGGFYGLMIDQDYRAEDAVKMSFGPTFVNCNPWALHLLAQRKVCLIPLLSPSGFATWNLEFKEIHYESPMQGLQMIYDHYYVHLQNHSQYWHGWWHRIYQSLEPKLYQC